MWSSASDTCSGGSTVPGRTAERADARIECSSTLTSPLRLPVSIRYVRSMSAQRELQTLHEFFDVVVRGEDVRREAQRTFGAIRPTDCLDVNAMRAFDGRRKLGRRLAWHAESEEIGRASCRERVEISVVAVSVKK